MAGDEEAPHLQRSNTTPRLSPSSPDDEIVKRSGSSALARFTRSVSKLRTRTQRHAPRIDSESANVTDSGFTSRNILRRSQTEVAADGGTKGVAFYKKNAASFEPKAHSVGTTKNSETTDLSVSVPESDIAAFLQAVPEMILAESRVSEAQEALKSTRRLAKSLRVAAQDAALVLDAEKDVEYTALTSRPPGASLQEILEWERAVHAVESAIAELRFRDAWHHLRTLETLADRTRDPNKSPNPAHQDFAWQLKESVAYWNTAIVNGLEARVSARVLSDQDAIETALLLEDIAGPRVSIDALLKRKSSKLQEEFDNLPLAAQAGSTGPSAESAACDIAALMGQILAEGIRTTFNCVSCGDYSSSVVDTTRLPPHVRGLVTQWALRELQSACARLRRLVILPLASPAGLKTTCMCIAAFLAYCNAIGVECGIPSLVIAQDALWHAVDSVLQRRLRQLGEGLLKAVQVEVSEAVAGNVALPQIEIYTWESLSAVFPSANRLLSEVKAMSEVTELVAGPKAIVAISHGLSSLFMAYSNAMAQALTVHPSGSKTLANDKVSAVAETAMEVATRLVEVSLAESTLSLASLGWGYPLDPMALVTQLEKMAADLGMDTVDHA